MTEPDLPIFSIDIKTINSIRKLTSLLPHHIFVMLTKNYEIDVKKAYYLIESKELTSYFIETTKYNIYTILINQVTSGVFGLFTLWYIY